MNTKIFGIGLSKTGTLSLSQALITLGFPTIHFDRSERTYNELTQGKYKLSIMNKVDAYVDGIAPFYPQLESAFPNSKFILTTRSETSWLRSIKKHTDRYRPKDVENKRKKGSPFFKIMTFSRAATFGSIFFNEERYLYVFRKHTQDVLDYFAKRNNLLVLNICDGDKWEKLCKFLDVPIPNKDFPHLNKTNYL